MFVLPCFEPCPSTPLANLAGKLSGSARWIDSCATTCTSCRTWIFQAGWLLHLPRRSLGNIDGSIWEPSPPLGTCWVSGSSQGNFWLRVPMDWTVWIEILYLPVGCLMYMLKCSDIVAHIIEYSLKFADIPRFPTVCLLICVCIRAFIHTHTLA